MLARKHSLIFRNKAPKCSKFSVAKIQETPVDLYSWPRTGIEFSSRNNFTNLVSFVKLSVPVESTIPWFAISCKAGVVISTHYLLTLTARLLAVLSSVASNWLSNSSILVFCVCRLAVCSDCDVTSCLTMPYL